MAEGASHVPAGRTAETSSLASVVQRVNASDGSPFVLPVSTVVSCVSSSSPIPVPPESPTSTISSPPRCDENTNSEGVATTARQRSVSDRSGDEGSDSRPRAQTERGPSPKQDATSAVQSSEDRSVGGAGTEPQDGPHSCESTTGPPAPGAAPLPSVHVATDAPGGSSSPASPEGLPPRHRWEGDDKGTPTSPPPCASSPTFSPSTSCTHSPTPGPAPPAFGSFSDMRKQKRTRPTSPGRNSPARATGSPMSERDTLVSPTTKAYPTPRTVPGTPAVASPRSRNPTSPRSRQGGRVKTDGMENRPITRWKKGKQIGQGGFGRVYVALDDDTGQFIAVKNVVVARREGKEETVMTEAIEQLRSEVDLMKKLEHKNIVQYRGMEENLQEGYVNIFMEYVPGGSVLSLLKEFGPFTDEIASSYGRQILEGLIYLHESNVVHRDIKGANILLTTEGDLRLADFGAAVQLAKVQEATGKKLGGTALWMPPEVIKMGSEAGVGWQQDIWSLGCTILEMLTARAPFFWVGETEMEILDYIADPNKEIPLPPPKDPDRGQLSDIAISFIKACLHKESSKRPTAKELLGHPYIKLSESNPVTQKDKEDKEKESTKVSSPASSRRRKKPLSRTYDKKWGSSESLVSETQLDRSASVSEMNDTPSTRRARDLQSKLGSPEEGSDAGRQGTKGRLSLGKSSLGLGVPALPIGEAAAKSKGDSSSPKLRGSQMQGSPRYRKRPSNLSPRGGASHIEWATSSEDGSEQASGTSQRRQDIGWREITCTRELCHVPIGVHFDEAMVLQKIDAASPAEEGGMKAFLGCVLTHIGTTPVGTKEQFDDATEKLTVISFRFAGYREGQRIKVLRSSGEWHDCTVASIDRTNSRYNLVLTDSGQQLRKDVPFTVAHSLLRLGPSSDSSRSASVKVGTPKRDRSSPHSRGTPEESSSTPTHATPGTAKTDAALPRRLEKANLVLRRANSLASSLTVPSDAGRSPSGTTLASRDSVISTASPRSENVTNAPLSQGSEERDLWTRRVGPNKVKLDGLSLSHVRSQNNLSTKSLSAGGSQEEQLSPQLRQRKFGNVHFTDFVRRGETDSVGVDEEQTPLQSPTSVMSPTAASQGRRTRGLTTMDLPTWHRTTSEYLAKSAITKDSSMNWSSPRFTPNPMASRLEQLESLPSPICQLADLPSSHSLKFETATSGRLAEVVQRLETMENCLPMVTAALALAATAPVTRPAKPTHSPDSSTNCPILNAPVDRPHRLPTSPSGITSPISSTSISPNSPQQTPAADGDPGHGSDAAAPVAAPSPTLSQLQPNRRPRAQTMLAGPSRPTLTRQRWASSNPSVQGIEPVRTFSMALLSEVKKTPSPKEENPNPEPKQEDSRVLTPVTPITRTASDEKHADTPVGMLRCITPLNLTRSEMGVESVASYPTTYVPRNEHTPAESSASFGTRVGPEPSELGTLAEVLPPSKGSQNRFTIYKTDSVGASIEDEATACRSPSRHFQAINPSPHDTAIHNDMAERLQAKPSIISSEIPGIATGSTTDNVVSQGSFGKAGVFSPNSSDDEREEITQLRVGSTSDNIAPVRSPAPSPAFHESRRGSAAGSKNSSPTGSPRLTRRSTGMDTVQQFSLDDPRKATPKRGLPTVLRFLAALRSRLVLPESESQDSVRLDVLTSALNDAWREVRGELGDLLERYGFQTGVPKKINLARAGDMAQAIETEMGVEAVQAVVLTLAQGENSSGITWALGSGRMVVRKVAPQSAAARANVTAGLRLLTVEGRPVQSEEALRGALQSLRHRTSTILAFHPDTCQSPFDASSPRSVDPLMHSITIKEQMEMAKDDDGDTWLRKKVRKKAQPANLIIMLLVAVVIILLAVMVNMYLLLLLFLLCGFLVF
eukprot:Sspe_Gene.54209::Locus_29933_Transcript_3_3_Confidence_0.625_Length_5792::g.54209::m.54209